jgi:Pyridoxamine 5'-phosphate oxidase
MAAREPVSAALIAHDATSVLPWSEAHARLADARGYWLATIHPSGAPHVRPVLSVWVDGAMHTTSNPMARKGRNLAVDERCSLTATTESIDFVLEGEAARVTDDDQLQRVAEAYIAKYEWPVTISDRAFEAPYGAPTAGAPPYAIYELVPRVVFAFGTNEEFAPRSTRYQF